MQYVNPEIISSYREHDLGRTLYELVLERRPKRIIEFGVLHGYSLVAMAMAIDEMGGGSITGYDLWDTYDFNHGRKELVSKELARYEVNQYVTLADGELFSWLEKPEQFDFLHVDISNKGDVIGRLYTSLKDRIAAGLTVVFEGGSEERDKVEWMVKYGCQPIQGSAPYRIINGDFPSLSLLG